MCTDFPISGIRTSRPGEHSNTALLLGVLLHVSTRHAGKAPRQSRKEYIDEDADCGDGGHGDRCAGVDGCMAVAGATGTYTLLADGA